jgi:hypothetical protein
MTNPVVSSGDTPELIADGEDHDEPTTVRATTSGPAADTQHEESAPPTATPAPQVPEALTVMASRGCNPGTLYPKTTTLSATGRPSLENCTGILMSAEAGQELR